MNTQQDELLYTTSDLAENFEQAVNEAHETGRMSDVEYREALRSLSQWIEQTQVLINSYQHITNGGQTT